MAENGWNNRRRNGGNPSSFCLPKLSAAFENDTAISPTSILDAEPFSTSPNSSLSEPSRDSPGKPDSSTCGNSAPESGPVLFGYKLDIQNPPLPNTSSSESTSLGSPSDFGITTRNPNLLSHNSAIPASPGFFSPREMEMSEDYTCVISHGPNPKTTHIYRDCILESYRDVVLAEFSVSPEPHEFGEMQSFLRFCYGCNKSLKENDVYMYRGEKAFCSCECRYKEVIIEERLEKLRKS